MQKRPWIIAGLSSIALFCTTTAPVFAASIPEPHYPKDTQKVTITWWTWTANADRVIAAFNKEYPNIKVVHPLIGAGATEYNKLTTAIKAGTGAPDVVQIEYQYLPKFIDTNGLLNIAPYVKQYQSSFQPWTWAQSSRGNAVYAIPEDIGPLAMFYRTSVFQKYHLPLPKTWAQFATEAKQLHKEAPSEYLTYFPVTDGGLITGLLWQSGAQLFQYTPNGWKIDLNSPKAKQVMNYWGNLVKEGVIPATNDGTPAFQSDLGSGKYAVMLNGAWAPAYSIEPYVRPNTKDWHAADIPQWSSTGPFVDGNNGGSTNAVTKQSKHPDAAALFAAWINTSQAGELLDVTDIGHGGRGQVPANKYGTQLPQFDAPNPSLDGQKAAPVFIKASKSVNTSFQWSPWTDYVYNQMTIEFTKAAAGQETWDQALDNLQHSVVVFAESMGYKVVANGAQADKSGSASSFWSEVNSPGLYVVFVLALLTVCTLIIRRSKTRS
ncbi:ABC transporter substrate-binding protein [Alicyclobacillus fastidiosus]|uniref:Sugar ABC transporter substrate-binding protein n=1 Tax=Alicyclobacillus fastidiosus TaxID=392011 RepID=A0ABV5AL27_9BACL|nr:sugar ABC transporter substrate-binding protein [Alicyclobacillus fastidiosus]WEH08858.1 sugar ABC transporter substrate-binding protein [Alicyclobacillus fastidiosus]